MAQNELSVDLRLALKKLKDDIREANRMIREGMSKTLNLGGTTKGTKDAGDEMDKVAVKTRRATTELERQVAVWKKLQNFRKPNVFIYGQTAMPKPNYSQYGPTLNPTQGPMGPGGGLATGAVLPGSGGTPPIIRIPPILPKPGGTAATPVKLNPQDMRSFIRGALTGIISGGSNSFIGQALAANQLFGAFSGKGGQAILSKLGMPTGMAGAGLATAAIMGLELAIKGLQSVIKESIAASERARQLYAKALSNGLGLGYNSMRGNLASVLGVSENEIYQFGGALAFLQPRLEMASKISADSATALAPLSYELRILKLDTEALFATIAADVVPALRLLINVLDELAKVAINFVNHIIYQLGALTGNFIPIGADPKKLMGDAGVVVGGMIGPLSEIIARALADTSRGLGAPSAFMKQMPVSSFERMGLVAGMSSSGLVDYTRRTAVATEAIARHVTNGNNIPRASFGLNPNVSNP